jgi:citrate transporter
MSPQQISFLIILIVASILLVTERIRNDLVAVLIVLALAITRVLAPSEALSGFGSEPALVVVSIFVMSPAFHQTGLAERIGEKIGALAGKGYTRIVTVLRGSVAVTTGVGTGEAEGWRRAPGARRRGAHIATIASDPAFLLMVPFHGESKPRRKARLTAVIVLCTIALAAFNFLSLDIITLAGATAMVLSGCITSRQAYKSIDARRSAWRYGRDKSQLQDHRGNRTIVLFPYTCASGRPNPGHLGHRICHLISDSR